MPSLTPSNSKSPLLIFDLDDTLYEECQFVLSGFKAVAEMAAHLWQTNYDKTLKELEQLLNNQGRGAVFDTWLMQQGIFSKKKVQQCLACYRNHNPQIKLNTAAQILLPQLPKPLYLVTDGNKQVQANKVKALDIADYFKRIFITHRFGIRHAKPSTYCFKLIQAAEKLPWQRMAYIGDNPNKDFVNLNNLGMITIRIRTGMFKDQTAKPGYDSRYTLNSLIELPNLMQQLEQQI